MANKKPSYGYSIQQNDIRAAKELFYPNDVIEALKHEPDPFKRERILMNARIASTK